MVNPTLVPASLAQSAMPALMTKQQIANDAQVGLRQVDYWIKDGKLPPPVRIGSHPRWPRQLIADWFSAGCPAVSEGGSNE